MFRYVGPYAIIAVSLFALVAHNLRDLHLPPRASGRVSPLQSLTDFGISLGSTLGVAPLWLMYSPVSQRIYVATVYVRVEGGEWMPTELPQGRGTLEYRSRRSFAEALLWDFKEARVTANYFVQYADRPRLKRYLDFHRRRLEDRLGRGPLDMRVVVKVATIPAPEKKGDWTPHNAEFRVHYDEEFE